jgi:hypothetical protein
MTGARVLRLLVIGLVGLVTLGALLQRLPGLQPVSLWLDDQWVAVLATTAPMSLVLTGDYPCPPGFVLLLRAVVLFAGGGELQLQMIPFLAGLAVIPLLAWVTTRATGNVALGIIAAVLIAGNHTLAVYGLRVKPFTFDALATTILLALAVTFLTRERTRTFAALAASAAIMPLLSFPSLLIGGVLVNFIGIATLLRHKEFTPPSVSRLVQNPMVRWMIAYNLAALLVYLLTMHGRGSSALLEGWTSHYLPIGDISALPSFLTNNVAALFKHAFPEAFAWLALWFPVGLVALMLNRRLRVLGISIAVIYGAFFVVSALGLYPIGERRTEAFMSPLTIFTAVSSLLLLHRPGSQTRPGAVPGTRGGAIAAFSVAVIFLVHFGLRVASVAYAYPDAQTGAATIIERANTVIEEGDGLIVHWWTSYAVGFYGRWPVEFKETEASSNAFYVIPNRRNTLVAGESRNGGKFADSPADVQRQLIPFLQRSPDRLFYIIDRAPSKSNEWIIDTILSQGYRLEHTEEHNRAMLMTFER